METRIWIDLESGTYGDATNMVVISTIRPENLDSMTDDERIAFGKEYGIGV